VAVAGKHVPNVIPSFPIISKKRKLKVMKIHIPNSPSAIEPRPKSTESTEERFKINFWMMRYEAYLFSIAPETTYERYTRALDKLFAFLPEKKFLHEFRRADFEDYKKHRLESGISAKTVNIELSIYRSFFDFLIRADADGVMYNPVRAVRVQMPSKKKSGQRRKLILISGGHG
jgi:hypothetical protein